jgi:hypothetical protein
MKNLITRIKGAIFGAHSFHWTSEPYSPDRQRDEVFSRWKLRWTPSEYTKGPRTTAASYDPERHWRSR